MIFFRIVFSLKLGNLFIGMCFAAHIFVRIGAPLLYLVIFKIK